MSWRNDFADILTEGRDLAPLTYYRIGGSARWFFEPEDAATAARLVASLVAEGQRYRVLGGGANVLIEDGVVHEIPFIHLGHLNQLHVDGLDVVAGAGVGFPRLVRDLTADGLAGCEGLAGVPGHVGGACAMNAGGRHGEFGDVVEWVELASETGEVIALGRDEVGFRYRGTSLPPGLVTAVSLRMKRGEASELRAFSGRVLKEKAAVQPLRLPSSGCVFKNPQGGSAGLLVEDLGLKGLRAGGAEISALHGNFIVNHGDATFADVVQLIRHIEAEALSQRGVTLEREMRIWPSEGF